MFRLIRVALRKESVDRNSDGSVCLKLLATSLSARRAWIEILYYGDGLTFAESLSARRAWIEMHVVLVVPAGCWRSLSARRAWIEMYIYITLRCSPVVALRKESVDRNKL